MRLLSIGALLVGCTGSSGSDIDAAVIVGCEQACGPLEGLDDCAGDYDDCVDDCSTVAGSLEVACGLCVADTTRSSSIDPCDEMSVPTGAPPCDQPLECGYDIGTTSGDCAAVCTE